MGGGDPVSFHRIILRTTPWSKRGSTFGIDARIDGRKIISPRVQTTSNTLSSVSCNKKPYKLKLQIMKGLTHTSMILSIAVNAGVSANSCRFGPCLCATITRSSTARISVGLSLIASISATLLKKSYFIMYGLHSENREHLRIVFCNVPLIGGVDKAKQWTALLVWKYPLMIQTSRGTRR